MKIVPPLLPACASFAVLAFAALAAPAAGQVRPDAVLLRYPDVSRDEIVFRYDDDLWTVDKRGGVARRITTAAGNESFPRFSPDGTRVAFMGGYDGGSDLYVLDVAAGVPERVTHHPSQELLCDWTPDGEALLFSSSMVSGQARAPRILRVPAGGGQPEPVPVPYGTFGSLDETGRYLAYTPWSYDFRTWKRYQGGLASDVWVYDLETGSAERITDYPGTDEMPMWHGRTVVFVSDRESGVRNLWAYDLDTRETRRLTDFRRDDVRYPAVGPEDVVFEAGGVLYRYEFATGERIPVEVVIPGARPHLRAQRHDVEKLAAGARPSPSGVRVVVEARGEAWSVPVKRGVTRNLTSSSGVAEREPAWSPDGKWVAYVSDRSGEYELALRRADGKPFEGADEHGERRLTSLGPGWKRALRWSPDSSRIAFSTNWGDLYVADAESGETTAVAEHPRGRPISARWSPDSRWLAWSQEHSETQLDAIQLHDTETGETHEVTSGLFDDSGPVFDRGGDWLYFVSTRAFEPLMSEVDNTWIFANGRNVCAVALRSDVADPFLPEDDVEEVPDDGAEEDEADEDESGGEDSGDEEDAEEDGAGDEDPATEGGEGEDEDEDEDAPERVEIDLDGFEERAIVLPIEPGRISGLDALEGKVLYLRQPRTGESGGKSKLQLLDLSNDDPDERSKEKTIVEDVMAFEVAAGGEKVLVARDGWKKVAVLDPKPDQDFEAIDLSGLVAMVEPRAEWRQLVRDAWRLYRDWFYDPGLHGLDWEAVGERYLAALADATSRDDVHWLIGEMMSELNAGHAYNRGPGEGLADAGPARPVGLLGCDWEVADGAYRVARIVGGGTYDADARSPLRRPGVDVREGDYLLAVNGAPVDVSRDVYAAFVGTAGKPTEVTVSSSPEPDGTERTVLVEPIPDETELRYRDWVARNRALVGELSGGRIGYVHVPDTAVRGTRELVRQFLGQMHKDALLVDERWNSGGFIPDRLVELLDRPLRNAWAVRSGADWVWPPVRHTGPKAMLVNGAAGSGGDCFPYYFRQSGLGVLVGTRTWGGLIGISGNPALIDGATPTVPTFGFYELDGTWGVEGHGVEPDIEVVDDPSEMHDGRDPQLLAAVEHLMAELEGWEDPVPQRPEGPDRSGLGIPELER